MGDTSAAIAANRHRGLERMADKLRAAGYTVIPPDENGGPRHVEFTEPAQRDAPPGARRGVALGRVLLNLGRPR